ncbi:MULTISPECIES: ribonuclease I [unclassified Acinetobacter]|uniref:ribonuclease T2 family protein n=1 Tax=unclassified Acinetobacter TaxID=196816 RepID=UPI0029343B39|nr:MULTISPECIES: ribonuclease I [unclassified Acinetobacter]WOE31312.1 ribonuclease I [Acinetobacter sp. SAAs470]WOE39508.1 ribonuclease I [Acinetobacter sp. SAAs474]
MKKMDHTIQFNHRVLYFVSSLVLYLVFSNTHANTVNGYVMGIQMTPAVCLMDSAKAKTRQCLEGYALNITGLYPETRQVDCQTNSSAALSPIQAKVVARVMPDERARVALWRGIGGCVPMNASQYFRNVINFADRLNIPAVMTTQASVRIQRDILTAMFIRLNPSLLEKSIHFQCNRYRNTTYLTNIKVCYNPVGQYKACAPTVITECPKTFTIKGSY